MAMRAHHEEAKKISRGALPQPQLIYYYIRQLNR